MESGVSFQKAYSLRVDADDYFTKNIPNCTGIGIKEFHRDCPEKGFAYVVKVSGAITPELRGKYTSYKSIPVSFEPSTKVYAQGKA